MQTTGNGQQLSAEALKHLIYLHAHPYLEGIAEEIVALILSKGWNLPPELDEVVREDVGCGLIVVPRCRSNWLESGIGVRVSVAFGDEELPEFVRKYHFIPGLKGQIETICCRLRIPNMGATGNRCGVARVGDLIEV